MQCQVQKCKKYKNKINFPVFTAKNLLFGGVELNFICTDGFFYSVFMIFEINS